MLRERVGEKRTDATRSHDERRFTRARLAAA
jgi:hypothetical protein